MAPESHKRRRGWERQVRLWESAVQKQLDAEREAQGLQPDEGIPDAVLVGEVTEMASSTRYLPMDAVIPAPRVDLARTWIKRRLAGELDSQAERQQFARELAPAPGGGHGPLRYPIGLDSSGESVRKGVEHRLQDSEEKSR
jgi:hypothetical protein